MKEVTCQKAISYYLLYSEATKKHLMHCFGGIIRHCVPTAIASSIWKMRKKLCRILFYGFGRTEKICLSKPRLVRTSLK